MQRFDAFSKPMREFQVKTRLGGAISIGTVVVICYLLFCEVVYFLEVRMI
jgi:hypothetical protein